MEERSVYVPILMPLKISFLRPKDFFKFLGFFKVYLCLPLLNSKGVVEKIKTNLMLNRFKNGRAVSNQALKVTKDVFIPSL